MAGEAVDEVVLAAVRLVGDDHDVAAVGERRMTVAPLLGQELLDGGEDHAARVHRELAAQICPALGLGRRLAQDVLAAGEDAEELVVEVVAVGEDDDGRVLHRGVAGDCSRVEGHGEALPRALGVPHDADAVVAGLAARPSARLVAPALLGGCRLRLLQLGRAQRLGDGEAHRVELVVAGDLLGEGSATVVLEHDEVAEESEEPSRVADALQHHLKLRHVGIGQRFAADGAPGLEPLHPRGERADAGLGPVGDH